jgi:hypothetical protein
MKSQETKERFIELRAKGYSFDKIKDELGVAKKTLVSWSRALDTEIEAAKALEIETLLEKHFLLKEQRLSRFGKILCSLDAEIEKRSLSEIPTDKLLEIRLKYQAALKEEIVEPRFLSEEEVSQEKEIADFLEAITGVDPKRSSLKAA